MDREALQYLLKRGRASLQCIESLSNALRRSPAAKQPSFVLIVNGLPDQKATQSFKEFIKQKHVIDEFVAETVTLLERMTSQLTPRTVAKQGLASKHLIPRMRESQATQTNVSLPPRDDDGDRTDRSSIRRRLSDRLDSFRRKKVQLMTSSLRRDDDRLKRRMSGTELRLTRSTAEMTQTHSSTTDVCNSSRTIATQSMTSLHNRRASAPITPNYDQESSRRKTSHQNGSNILHIFLKWYTC